MTRKTVMCDVDGVLANFSLGFRTLARELGMAVEPYGHEDPRHTSWDWPDIQGEALERVWRAVKDSAEFWYRLEPLVTEDEKQRLRDMEPHVKLVFVTARVGRDVELQTEAWLEDEIKLVEPVVLVTAAKGSAARALRADYSIEDKAGNAVYIAYHTRGRTRSYIVDRPYNRFDHAVLGSQVRRVRTVGEFLDDVEAGR